MTVESREASIVIYMIHFGIYSVSCYEVKIWFRLRINLGVTLGASAILFSALTRRELE